MATPNQMAQKRELASQLRGQGYAFTLTDWPRRITWFKPSGEAMPNLPADPWHMERYLARGFTPDLPKAVVAEQRVVKETVIPEPAASKPVCGACGQECKSAFGLRAHMRSHKEK